MTIPIHNLYTDDMSGVTFPIPAPPNIQEILKALDACWDNFNTIQSASQDRDRLRVYAIAGYGKDAVRRARRALGGQV